jgi:hypothetical protein
VQSSIASFYVGADGDALIYVGTMSRFPTGFKQSNY